MKRATVILLLIIQIALLFIFQNVYTLLREYEAKETIQPERWLSISKQLTHIFFALTLITAILLLGTGIYLIFRFRKPRGEPDEGDDIPPLQNYLVQLKTSETRLKGLVESQQEKVAEKEELNKRIVNNIDAAIILVNPRGRIEIFNRSAENMFSQSLANALNNTPEIILRVFPELFHFIGTQCIGKTAVNQEISSGGRVFLVHANPMETTGLLVIIRDVTEEKKREEIDRRNSNFIMLGEMTAFLAHEVRNSLGVILGYSRMIKSDEKKTEKINREIDFLTGMMESFLNFSKPIKIEKKELIDLPVLIREIARENNLSLDMPQESYSICSDPGLLTPVFSNLLINAREAGANRIQATFKKTRELVIEIKDNGRGIEPKNRDKIWFPFFTTREKGTGMGLPSIRKIINTMNGEIVLTESLPGETTFRITFFNQEESSGQ